MDRALIIAPAAGAALGATVWLWAGGNQPPMSVGRLDAALSAPAARAGARPQPSVAIQALATPLFPSELAGGAPAPTISLEGVVNFPGRTAALLSIAGAPAQWLALGDEKDGVLLEAVEGAKIRVATIAGALDLVIGDAPAAPTGTIAVAPEAPQ